MKPERLEFIGLKSYSEKTVVDFSALTENGLFGIFGATGSGKSTILDAIFYALYGDFSSGKVKNEEFVNLRTGYFAVEFRFSITENGEKERYVVKREYHPATETRKTASSKARLSVFKDGLEYPIADNPSTATDRIKKILGLEPDQFEKCIVLPQGRFSAFLTMPKSERLKILSALFDLEKYGMYLRGKLKVCLDGFENKLSMLTGKLEGYSEYNSDAKNAVVTELSILKKLYEDENVNFAKITDDFNNYKDNYERHNKLLQLKEKLGSLEILNSDFVKKEERIKNYKAAKTAIDLYGETELLSKEYKELEQKYSAALFSLENLKARISDEEQLRLRIEKLKGETERLKYFSDSLTSLSDEEKTVISKRNERDALADKFRSLSSSAAVLKDEISSLEKIIDNLKADDLSLNIENEIDLAIDKLSRSEKGKLAAEEIDFLTRLKVVVSGGEDEISQRVTQLSVFTAVGADKDGVLSKLRNALDVKQRSFDKIAKLNGELNDKKAALSKTEADISLVVESGKLIKESIDAFSKKQGDIVNNYIIEFCGGNSFGQTVGLKDINARLENTRQTVEKLVAEKEEYQRLFPVLNNDLRHYEESMRSLSDKMSSLKERMISALGVMTLAYAKEVVESVSDYEAIVAQRERYLAEKEAVIKETEQIKSQLADDDYSLKAYEEKRLAVENGKNNLNILYKRYTNCEKSSEIIIQKFNERCIIEKDFERVKSEKSVYDVLFEAVKSNRLVDYIADEYLSEICVDAEKTLSELSSGRYGLKYKGDFFVVDYLNGGAERKTATVSGGELFLVSLSLALSLSKSIIAKSNKPIEFFFLDEGFGSLDSELVEIVVDSLEKLKSKNFTIGLISHVEALKERISAKLNVLPPTLTSGSRIVIS